MTNTPDVIWLHGQHSNELATALAVLCPSQKISMLTETTARADAPALAIFALPVASTTPLVELSAHQVQQHWQQHGLTVIQGLQTTIKAMLKRPGKPVQRGTVVILGSALVNLPQAEHLLTTSLHAGVRNVAQALAREFGPQGIHVVYVASPRSATAADLVALAWQLHQQPSSVWAQEVQMLDC